MKPTFKPFIIASPGGSEPVFNPGIAIAAQAAPAVQALPIAATPSHQAGSLSGSVALVHEGGRVARIRVTCGCGSVHELACEY